MPLSVENSQNRGGWGPIHALLGSSMPLIMGLTMVASRSTTNSKPSPETRVTYLLGVCVVAMLGRLRVQRQRRRSSGVVAKPRVM